MLPLFYCFLSLIYYLLSYCLLHCLILILSSLHLSFYSCFLIFLFSSFLLSSCPFFLVFLSSIIFLLYLPLPSSLQIISTLKEGKMTFDEFRQFSAAANPSNRSLYLPPISTPLTLEDPGVKYHKNMDSNTNSVDKQSSNFSRGFGKDPVGYLERLFRRESMTSETEYEGGKGPRSGTGSSPYSPHGGSRDIGMGMGMGAGMGTGLGLGSGGMTGEKGVTGKERSLFRENEDFLKGLGVSEVDGPSTLL